MTTHFHTGFADELIKTGGVRDIVKRIVQGKPLPKMGFFEKRRMAKALGVKPSAVTATLMERQQKDRLTKAMIAGGGLSLGTVAGGALDKQAGGSSLGPRGRGPSPGTGAPPKPVAQGYAQYQPKERELLQRRDDLMKKHPSGPTIAKR